MSLSTQMPAAIAALKGRLIVSCQASPGDPLDDLETLRRIACACLRGGAAALRAEGAERVHAYRELTEAPILGLIKRFDENGDVYITPDFASAQAVTAAGASVVALDCTSRRLHEAEPWPLLIQRIHEELGRPVCADIATLEDALLAEDHGADAIATTLCGYTDETREHRSICWPLVASLVQRIRIPVIVEGHITSPEELSKALSLGAHAVVVGSAITRPESITARFAQAARQAIAARKPASTVPADHSRTVVGTRIEAR